MNQLRIVLVGPTRVGKTSLLTAMYDRMEAEVQSLGWVMTPDPSTRGLLNSKRNELIRLANGGELKPQEMGIESDSVVREYAFIFDDENGLKISIHFTDVPGGIYVHPDRFVHEYPKAKKNIEQANVFIVAVDAIALMESPPREGSRLGRWHNMVNEPKAIYEAYKSDMCHALNHRVLFVLAKSETYVEKGRTNEMITALGNGYADLLSFMRPRGVKALACAVETVGVLRLLRVVEQGGTPVAEFYRHEINQYTPRDCELPLRYALEVLLVSAVKSAKDEVNQKNTWWRRIVEGCGGNTDLKVAHAKEMKFEGLLKAIVGKIDRTKLREL